jgi:hypothetical protein
LAAALAGLAFGAAALALRGAGFADLRGADALRGADFAAGFRVRAAFFAAIKFSGLFNRAPDYSPRPRAVQSPEIAP